MSALSCPVAIINAPVEMVLELLEPRNWSKWNDGSVISLSPAGSIVNGQEAIIVIKKGLITLKIKVKVIEIDKPNNRIRYDVFFPFGFKVEEDLRYTKLKKTTCRVNYNCHFIFQDGLKG